eukprot:403371043
MDTNKSSNPPYMPLSGSDKQQNQNTNYELKDFNTRGSGVRESMKKVEIPEIIFDQNKQIVQTQKKPESLWEFLTSKEVPKKAVFLAFMFMIIGLLLFFIGFFEDMREWDPFNGFLFWGSGLVLAIPGFYYTYKVIQAYKATDENVRRNILRDIPDM